MPRYLLAEDDGLHMRPCGRQTEIKLDYLTRYINAFETAMRDRWRVRYYIDLLAGSGKNRIKGTNQILLGSPLLALTTKHPFTGYYFSDKDNEKVEALELRCEGCHLHNRVSIRQGDCNEVVNIVVSELRTYERRSLNLAFLDPQGMELQWNTVAKLASIKRMDLIIYYPDMGLARNLGLMARTSGETKLDRFFGGYEWREIFLEWQGKRGLYRRLIELYKSKLTELGYTDVFRGDEDLGDEPLIRSHFRNAPLYRLIFASKDNLGYKLWRDIIRRDVYGQRRLF